MVFKFEELIKMAANHIASADPVLSPIISRYGICTIRPHTNYYRELVESIISHQLSVKAAASINRKFIDLFDAEFPSPSAILENRMKSLEALVYRMPKQNILPTLPNMFWMVGSSSISLIH